MTFKEDWNKERDRKRLERETRAMQRSLSTPVARGEVYRLGETQMMHLASLALAFEALEDILIGKGILEEDELMDVMHILAARKEEQVRAAQAVAAAAEPSRIICNV